MARFLDEKYMEINIIVFYQKKALFFFTFVSIYKNQWRYGKLK